MVIFLIYIVSGMWLIISPWALGYSAISLMKWNNLIIGALLVILNFWIIFQKRVEKSSDD